MFPTNNGKFITASPEIVRYIEERAVKKLAVKDIDNDIEKLEKEIIQFIADNDGLLNEEEKIIATFQANKNGTRSLRIK